MLPEKQGFIYVLEHNNEHFKIGRANNWNARIKQLKIQLPFRVTVAYAFASSDCYFDETNLHEVFAAKRLNGEWFALDLDDFAFLAEYCNYTGFYELADGTIRRDPFFEATQLEQVKWDQVDHERWANDDFLETCEVWGEVDDPIILTELYQHQNERREQREAGHE